MNVEPISLQGRTVRLEPLGLHHTPALMQAADPQIFTYIPGRPTGWTQPAFDHYVEQLLLQEDMCPFAAILCETGRACGVTTYMDIRPAHRGLEIGSTWLGRAYWGTPVNPECKYLLLRHAFEQLGAIRVQLKTDARNLHSQAAIAKLGAKLEGTLRKHIVMPDGFFRDTVMFSITDDEWPTVKAGLLDRLGYAP